MDNARLFEAAGAATVLVGDDATPYNLVKAIGHYLGDAETRRTAGLAAQRLAGSDAAGAAARLILERTGG